MFVIDINQKPIKVFFHSTRWHQVSPSINTITSVTRCHNSTRRCHSPTCHQVSPVSSHTRCPQVLSQYQSSLDVTTIPSVAKRHRVSQQYQVSPGISTVPGVIRCHQVSTQYQVSPGITTIPSVTRCQHSIRCHCRTWCHQAPPQYKVITTVPAVTRCHLSARCHLSIRYYHSTRRCQMWF